jgi:transcriptional regulator with XRE-family HTH domain
MRMNSAPLPVGRLLREWRQRRRMSQLDLALEAEISSRHLSFVETGRARPSRDMVLHLAEQLDVPLRARNALLTAAGYAGAFSERPLTDPALEAARAAIDLVLQGHEPYPALLVDRRWTLVASNRAVGRLLEGVDPQLLAPPVNVLRLALHPDGLARRTANLAEWRDHLLSRLRREIEVTADPDLATLTQELTAYPAPKDRVIDALPGGTDYGGVLIPLRLVTDDGLLNFFSTTTVFGTPMDVTLSELAVEAFFPADAATGERLRRMAAHDAAT